MPATAVGLAVRLTATTTTLTAMPTTVNVGQTVTLTATVSGGSNPTGTVTFAITGHDGTAFSCDSGDTQTLDGSDMAQFGIAAGLLADDSPYAVTATY